MLKTAFWKHAAASLPAPVCQRYLAEFERAERWELALEGMIELLSRAKTALSFRGLAAR
jgi:hypothetical protein